MRSRSGSKPTSRGMAFLLGSLLVSVSPIVAAAILVGQATEVPATLDPPVLAEFTVVKPVETRENIVVRASISRTDGPAVLSSGYQDRSVITSVFIAPASRLRNGDPVFEVNGATVVLAATPKPFHRPLARGSRGADVAMLEQWLSELGYLSGDQVDERLRRATVAAIRSFNLDRGVADTDALETFDPGSVVWPEDGFRVVAETFLGVGRPAPSLGEVIARGPTTYRDVIFEGAAGTSLELPGRWEWIVAGQVVGEIADGHVSSETIARAASRAGDEDAQETGELIVPGTVRRIEPVVRYALPVGSVLSDGGATCIIVREGEVLIARSVTVVGGDFGSVWIEPAPDPDVFVLANPLEYLDAPSCR